MYLGHVAVGLAAKRLRPELPVLALIVAPIALDLGDIALAIAHVSRSGAYTHTVPAACGWLVGVGLLGLVRWGGASALVLAALCATHVPLDYVTSRMEVWPGGPVLGWFLYGTPAADFAVEATVIVVAWWVYRRTLPEAARRGWAVIGILGVMLVLQGLFDALSYG
jgi:hypothetical protein